jgi:hypothetical protein
LHRNKIGARNHIFVSNNYYVNLSKLARLAGTLFSIGAAEKKSIPTGKISPFGQQPFSKKDK